MDLKELQSQFGKTLDAANILQLKADTEGRDLTTAEKSALKGHFEDATALRKQITEMKADENIADQIRQLGEDLGFRSDPQYSQLGGGRGDFIPGTSSHRYRPSSVEPWAKSVAEAVADADSPGKHAPLGPSDPLPVALPAPRLVEMGLPVLWTRDLLPNGEARGGEYRYMRQARRGWNAADHRAGCLQAGDGSGASVVLREGRGGADAVRAAQPVRLHRQSGARRVRRREPHRCGRVRD